MSNPFQIQKPESKFHDRGEGHFQTWMQLEGLAPDVSDQVVMDAMHAYFDKHTHVNSIYPHVSQLDGAQSQPLQMPDSRTL